MAPMAMASKNEPYPRRATVRATMTLASEAIDCMERSMPPSMMTKVTPVARMNSTAVSLARSKSALGCRKLGWAIPTRTTRTASVASGSHFRRSSGSQRHRRLLHRQP